MTCRVAVHWLELFTEEVFKGLRVAAFSLRACLRFGLVEVFEFPLLLTLGCELNLAWRDVRSLSVPLFVDGEVK